MTEADEDAEDDAIEDDRPRLVRFGLGDRELLVPVESVREVLVAGAVTRLPGSAPAIVGVTSVRGRIVAVVDASAPLGASRPLGRDRFLVVTTPGGPVALVVDRVDAVVATTIEPVAGTPWSAVDEGAPDPPLVIATATIDGRSIPVIDAAAAIRAAIEATGIADDSGTTPVDPRVAASAGGTP